MKSLGDTIYIHIVSSVLLLYAAIQAPHDDTMGPWFKTHKEVFVMVILAAAFLIGFNTTAVIIKTADYIIKSLKAKDIKTTDQPPQS